MRRVGALSHRPTAPGGSPRNRVVLTEPKKVAVRRSILSIGRSVDEWVYHARGPSQDRSYDVEPGVPHAIHHDVHDHEGKEAGQETEEDGQHQGGQARIFFFLFRRLAA